MKILSILAALTVCIGAVAAQPVLNVTNSPTPLAPYQPSPGFSLAWSPNTNSAPGVEITNYSVYWGLGSSNYTAKMSVGTNLAATVTGLAFGTEYFINVTCWADGIESSFGGQTTLTTPSLPPPPIPGAATVVALQAAPSLSGPWSNLCVMPFSPPAFFRLQFASSP
jgi:hypothetical protein